MKENAEESSIDSQSTLLLCVVCVQVVTLRTLTTVMFTQITTVMPIAQQGLDGLASLPDPCVPYGSQKTKPSKTKE